MSIHRNEIHAKKVAAWEEENIHDLQSRDLIHLFACAIRAIEKRSLNTLSSVTVKVVMDRALHENKERFPILSVVVLDTTGMKLESLFDAAHGNPDELRVALRSLLVELLNVFGNITADVLTAPLHQELSLVNLERAMKELPVKGSYLSDLAKANRGES